MTVATPTSPTSPFHLSVHRILEKEQKEDHSDEYDDLESGNCKSFRESVLKVIEQNAIPQVQQLMAIQGMRDYRDTRGHSPRLDRLDAG